MMEKNRKMKRLRAFCAAGERRSMQKKFVSKKYENGHATMLGDLGPKAAAYEDLINFSIGDPDLKTDDRIIEAAFADAKAGYTHYTDTRGMRELRDAIRAFYREEFDFEVADEEVAVTTSACQGMWAVMQAVLDEGDEVIVPEPYFSPYKDQIEMAGGVLVPLPTCEEENFEVNVHRIEPLITPRTKAILFNTPNTVSYTHLKGFPAFSAPLGLSTAPNGF